MSDLEALIRSIVRDELQAVSNPETRSTPTKSRARRIRAAARKPSGSNLDSLTPGQKAARTRKLRAAGFKAWETRRRNEAAGL